MDFLNSLSEVAKNRQNFKKWEDHQDDVEAQRAELHKRRQPSTAQVQTAKELGERIIDVVDIMDNHSENVAENVETAVDPLSSITTMLAFFGGNFLIGKHSTHKHLNNIQDIRRKYREGEIADELAKRIDESQQKHGKCFSNRELTKKSEIERIKDPVLKKEARTYFSKMKKETKPLWNKIMKNHGLMALGSIGVFIAATIFEAKLQTDSSKIARYQARKELDDPKAFVNYTPEQIAAAQKELKEHPELKKEEKKSKLKSGMIASIYNILRDRGSYLKDKSATTDDSKKVTRALSHEEVLQAQKDKEVIQRSVRKINNEAEKYSENMEVAANVIMGATPILGATVGALVSWIMTKSGATDRFVDKTVAKYGSDEAKTALESYRKIKKPDFFSKQWGKFAEELFYERKDRYKLYDTAEEAVAATSKAAQKSKKNLFTENTRKFFAAALAHKSGRNWILGIAGGIITGFAGMLMALKLQKSSARAGRYTAKRELEKDPKNFIGYSEEDFAEVKDVKNNKKKPSTIKEYALFIPTVIKQYWAYNKYRKNEYKEKQALNGLLRKQEVSETQLKDAKNLQRKIFNTFEKVDDNSQIYSESMEAATEIAQPFVWYGGMLVAASPLIYGVTQVARGKISPAKALQKIIDKLSSGSNILKKKWFKTYLGNVEKNIPNKLQNTAVDAHLFGTVFKGVDLANEPLISIIGKVFRNAQEGVGEFAKLSESKQSQMIYEIGDNLRRLKDNPLCPLSEEKMLEMERFVNIMQYGYKMNGDQIGGTSQFRADMLEVLINPKKFKNADGSFSDYYYDLTRCLDGENIESITGITSNMSMIQKLNKDSSTKEIVNVFAEIMGDSEFKKMLNMIDSNDFEAAIKNMAQNPALASQMAKMPTSYINTIKQFLGEDALKSIKFVTDENGVVSVSLSDNIKLMNALINRVKSGNVKDVMKMFPEMYRDPKVALAKLKNVAETSTDEQFADLAERMRFKSMDRKTCLEIIPKLEKMLDNLPKEELDKIWSTLVKEMSEHPDELMKLALEGNLYKLFVTPGMKNALIAAGVSWFALNVLLTYAVEQWLADMQLKAGRLGVMKAMQSLDDPAYYANVEFDQSKASQAVNPQGSAKVSEPSKVQESLPAAPIPITVSATENSANLLTKFKK